MAFGGFSNGKSNQPMAEINMVPLIDVMLVLLVIFIIAAPLMTHAVKIELPRASSAPESAKPEVVHLSIDASGNVYWNDVRADEAAWRIRMAEAAKQEKMPEVRIRADAGVTYRIVAQVMADAAKAGLNQIGFVTLPAD